MPYNVNEIISSRGTPGAFNFGQLSQARGQNKSGLLQQLMQRNAKNQALSQQAVFGTPLQNPVSIIPQRQPVPTGGSGSLPPLNQPAPPQQRSAVGLAQTFADSGQSSLPPLQTGGSGSLPSLAELARGGPFRATDEQMEAVNTGLRHRAQNKNLLLQSLGPEYFQSRNVEGGDFFDFDSSAYLNRALLDYQNRTGPYKYALADTGPWDQVGDSSLFDQQIGETGQTAGNLLHGLVNFSLPNVLQNNPDYQGRNLSGLSKLFQSYGKPLSERLLAENEIQSLRDVVDKYLSSGRSAYESNIRGD